MGRPRKQPRRIVTFNLDVTTADRIDDLGISNRSEWANKALLEVMDGRLAQRQDLLERHNEATVTDIQNDLLESLEQNPHRLAAMLFNSLNIMGFGDLKIKGRYTLAEQLRLALNRGTLKPDFESYDDAVQALKLGVPKEAEEYLERIAERDATLE